MGQSATKISQPAGPKRLLILGCEEAGKTVLSLRLGHYLHISPSDKELNSYRRQIQRTILRSFKETLRKINVQKFKTDEPGKFKYFRIILEQEDKMDVCPEIVLDSMANISECMIYWKNESNGHMSYFVEHLRRIFSPIYAPTVEDMVHCYRPTSDMRETIIEGREDVHATKIIEIAGSRNARRRWIQSLEKFDTIIFMTSSLFYKFGPDFEESVTYFETIFNSRLFSRTKIVLVFTKIDMLQKEKGEDIRATLEMLKLKYFEVADCSCPVYDVNLMSEKSTEALIKNL